MIDSASIAELGHRDVYDATGSRIGETSEVYLDDETGLPEWVTVKTGLFGTKESFVPLRDAQLTTEGLRVPVGKDVVKDAPKIDPDGRLSPSEERELYRYYGLERGPARDAAAPDRAPRTVTEPAHPVDAVQVGAVEDVRPAGAAGDAVRDENQVSGPLDPPEAQRNVAAPATEKPILRRYGER
ncbi:PRC-barrel domain-containing protein [Blastococcus xanthinilyticus]|uniref:PRC-barrel domain protein n=1 Tax=Blastococcus xanthinilyticus TaxID=1564164 RepID=A0A5S5CYZ9_9ACTN|nr:PRC-barrel domain-containing protein [Blastococcus xanthinilyticus]TYP88086.1 PRC-barrel domain protein [Blastococcus xanthinilyticus]